MDNNIKFQSCHLALELEAQSPMIHFQSGEMGATLRASEVKPKFDKFLIDKMKAVGKDYSPLLMNGQDKALDYKMKIQAKGEIYKIDINDGNFKNKEPKYDMYYGNMGITDEKDMKYGIISDPIITITCFKKELQQFIENSIEEFILVTNFGTMQGKGFGSFAPAFYHQSLNKTEIKQVGEWLKEKAGAKKCYIMEFHVPDTRTTNRGLILDLFNTQCKKMLNEVKMFYSDMKSGNSFGGYDRSFIYQYMHNKGIDNEKAWMKQSGIAPKIAQAENKKNQDIQAKNPFYVRAFLGLGEHIQFINDLDNKGDKATITMKETSKEIDRLPSPVFFKVVRNVVFIVPNRINPAIYDKEFSFTSSISKRHILNAEGSINESKTGTIKTLPKDSFDIDDFMECYVRHYNGELRDHVKKMRNNVEVGEVNE